MSRRWVKESAMKMALTMPSPSSKEAGAISKADIELKYQVPADSDAMAEVTKCVPFSKVTLQLTNVH